MTLEQIRATVTDRNVDCFLRTAFVALGVDGSNIKSVYHSPNGFAPNPRRYCVILHTAVRLSQAQVNWIPGLSGAVVNGSVWWVNVGKG